MENYQNPIPIRSQTTSFSDLEQLDLAYGNLPCQSYVKRGCVYRVLATLFGSKFC